MANIFNILRSRCIAQSNSLVPLISSQLRWSSSAEHTLQVRKDIKKQREASRLGGGAKRIDSQHHKVLYMDKMNILPIN